MSYCLKQLQLNFAKLIFTLIGFFGINTQLLASDLNFAFIVPGATESCPITNIDPTDDYNSPRHYLCDGRVYTVSVPDGCEYGGCGLILDQHGVLMNAENQNDGTQMRKVAWNAEDRGAETPYIVIQPNLGPYISGGQTFPGDFSKEKVLDFILAAIEAWDIDESRVHAHGFSQGTQEMVYRLICENSDLFASYGLIASIMSPMDCELPTNPVIEIVGMSDVNYYILNVIGDQRDNYLDLMGDYNEQSIHYDFWWWVYGSGNYKHLQYTGNGYHYEYVVHSAVGGGLQLITLGFDGGHCLPNGRSAENLIHEVTCWKADFKLGEMLMDFYIAHPQD